MFTGIVRGIGVVETVEVRPGLNTIQVQLPEGATDQVELGASIAIDGVCLTVSQHSGKMATFDVMQQTLQTTTLGKLTKGSRVNIERAARTNQEVGGHQLSGHIDCTAEIVRIEKPENNHVLFVRVAPEWVKYIFAKGYIAINGASLTVAAFDRATREFSIWLIPETLRLTTFGAKGVGDLVNVEIDRTTQILVDSVYGFLEQRLAEGALVLK